MMQNQKKKEKKKKKKKKEKKCVHKTGRLWAPVFLLVGVVAPYGLLPPNQ
jgi:hypothetical protein